MYQIYHQKHRILILNYRKFLFLFKINIKELGEPGTLTEALKSQMMVIKNLYNPSIGKHLNQVQ